VVLFKRLDESEKVNACKMIPSLANAFPKDQAAGILHSIPHYDGYKDKSLYVWPETSTVEGWRNWGMFMLERSFLESQYKA
jgi:hypothetical protein